MEDDITDKVKTPPDASTVFTCNEQSLAGLCPLKLVPGIFTMSPTA